MLQPISNRTYKVLIRINLMSYLFRNNLNEYEKHISRNLEFLVDFVRKKIGNQVETIFLSGSLSKGQGSGYLNKNKKLILVGDYDIICVTKLGKPFFWAPSMPHMADYKFLHGNAPVTVNLIPKRKLKNIRPTIEYWDWVNSRQVLFGNPQVFDQITFRRSRNHLSHVISIIFNRFVYLVREVGDLKNMDNQIEFSHWLAKAIIGIADARLVMAESYVSRFQDKLKKLLELGVDEGFIQNFKRALRIIKYPEKVSDLDLLFDAVKRELRNMLYLINSDNPKNDLDLILPKLNRIRASKNLSSRLRRLKWIGRPDLEAISYYAYVYLLFSIKLKDNKMEVDNINLLDKAVALISNSYRDNKLLLQLNQCTPIEKWKKSRELLREMDALDF